MEFLPVGLASNGPDGVIFSPSVPMPGCPEPAIIRGVAFVDGQNLFNAAKRAFGYSYPNYDITRLAPGEWTLEADGEKYQVVSFGEHISIARL